MLKVQVVSLGFFTSGLTFWFERILHFFWESVLPILTDKIYNDKTVEIYNTPDCSIKLPEMTGSLYQLCTVVHGSLCK